MSFVHDEKIGGVPVEVTTTRRETVYIEMAGAVRLIERILENKAIATVKQSMIEYCETLVAPWSWYDTNLTASTTEIVDEMQGPNNFPLNILLNGVGLIEWKYHGFPEEGYTAEQWANILGVAVIAPTFEQALAMFKEAVSG